MARFLSCAVVGRGDVSEHHYCVPQPGVKQTHPTRNKGRITHHTMEDLYIYYADVTSDGYDTCIRLFSCMGKVEIVSTIFIYLFIQ